MHAQLKESIVSNNLEIGIILVVLAGVMEGTYAVPTRYTPQWKWEHIWGAGSLMSLLLVAWPVAALTVPDLRAIFAEAGWREIALPALLGAGWGAGGIFFGLGVNIVGIAVGVTLILGLIALIGSLVPLIALHPEQLARPAGQVMIAALVVMLGGIILSGIAGNLRDKARREHSVAAAAATLGSSYIAETPAPAQKPRTSYKLGLFFCVLSGILSPMVNLALIKGDTLRQLAMQHRASPVCAVNALWLLVFTAAYGVFVLYAVYLMLRHGTASDLRSDGTAAYWMLAAVMGILWAGGVVVYGIGVAYMGGFGAYAGWPLMLIVAITAGNVSGILMGEWKHTGTRPLAAMIAALAVLFLAAVMLGFANRMLSA
jgi:L-rhamnose-H+ transport protein